MKYQKKILKTTLILLFSLAFIFIVYYFFNDIFKVEGEARLVKMNLPVETQNLQFSIDGLRAEKLDWKETLLLEGWVFRPNGKENKREVCLVLKSDRKTLLFTIEKDSISRPDVARYFKMDTTLNTFGFAIHIPVYLLKEDTYHIGLVLLDETGKYFSMTSNLLVKSGASYSIKGGTEVVSKSLAGKISIQMKTPTKQIKYGIDNLISAPDNYKIIGWAFLDGMNSASPKIYVLLKKNETVSVFSTDILSRKDVTAFFKSAGVNVDSSGFSVKLPGENIEKGRYQIGLYVVIGNQTGLVYTDKYIELGK